MHDSPELSSVSSQTLPYCHLILQTDQASSNWTLCKERHQSVNIIATIQSEFTILNKLRCKIVTGVMTKL